MNAWTSVFTAAGVNDCRRQRLHALTFRGLCVSVLYDMFVDHDREPCKTAEAIEMSSGMWTHRAQVNVH